jgi:hypothetical protein
MGEISVRWLWVYQYQMYVQVVSISISILSFFFFARSTSFFLNWIYIDIYIEKSLFNWFYICISVNVCQSLLRWFFFLYQINTITVEVFSAFLITALVFLSILSKIKARQRWSIYKYMSLEICESMLVANFLLEKFSRLYVPILHMDGNLYLTVFNIIIYSIIIRDDKKNSQRANKFSKTIFPLVKQWLHYTIRLFLSVDTDLRHFSIGKNTYDIYMIRKSRN